jgi:hypothetical protein
MNHLRILAILVAVLGQPLAAQGVTHAIPGAPGDWVLPEGTLIAPFLGRPALWLRNGQRPYRQDVTFLEGTIEFDVAPMPGAVFVGVTFRRESRAQYETIYFRPGDNGQWDAVQYMPRVGDGSQWQLYPQYQAAATLPEGQWTHVRVVVIGDSLRLFVAGSGEPVLEVPRLRGVVMPGTVGFWVNGAGDSWAAAISNVLIQPTQPTGTAGAPPDVPSEGFITRWEASPVLPADSGPVRAIPPVAEWTEVSAEEDGLVNLTLRYGQPEGRNTVFLRRRLDSPETQSVPLEITYSDEITVFLNGRPLYSGVNRWEGRYPGFLASLALGAETVYLPLASGRNDLVVAVTDEAFGWGLIARLPSGSDMAR